MPQLLHSRPHRDQAGPSLTSQSLITRPPEDGALNQLWAVTCPVEEARGLSGKYVVPFQRIGQPRLDLEERETVEKLWAWCDAEAKRHL
jgi:hypothetical protein